MPTAIEKALDFIGGMNTSGQYPIQWMKAPLREF